MSFFQTLLNSYKPYQIDKNYPDDYRTSLIYSSYNSCYPIVDNTTNSTAIFRKKVACETMLFLLAYGISYVVQKKDYSEFEYKGLIWTVSKLLSEVITNDIKNYGIDKKFIEDRIFNYADLLNSNDDSFMLYTSILLNEKPLSHTIKNSNDFPKIIHDSKLVKNLGEVMSLSKYQMQAVELMKQAVNKSYGLK